LFIFFGFFYSAKPIRAKTKPGLDMLFNALYIFPGVMSYALLTGEMSDFRLMLAATLWCMAMHAYSAVPDILTDQKAKIQTVATVLGKSSTMRLCGLMYTLSAGLSYKFIGVPAVLFGGVYLGLILASLNTKTPDQLMSKYRYFPRINTGLGFILFWLILNKTGV
jgi:lycopene elongase/hydratase (dihydrobisanhydrobacterioruberin-forming)